MPNSKILKAAAEELAKRANQGDDLAMDYASRMQRAKDMGFDTSRPVYHGTATDFDAFDPDRAIGTQFWSTTDKPAIEAGEVGAQGSGVIKEMYQNIQNPASWDEYDRLGIDELIGRGYDGVALEEGGETTYIAFKPEQYRDVNAAFDPAKKSSANLLASKGAGFVPVGGALAVGAGLTPEEAMADEMRMPLHKRGDPVTMTTLPFQEVSDATKQAEREYLHGIGGPLEHKIEAPSSPLLYSLADKIGQADRATQGHPANLLIPTGLGDWARKASFDEADWGDRVWAAMDVIP